MGSDLIMLKIIFTTDHRCLAFNMACASGMRVEISACCTVEIANDLSCCTLKNRKRLILLYTCTDMGDLTIALTHQELIRRQLS